MKRLVALGLNRILESEFLQFLYFRLKLLETRLLKRSKYRIHKSIYNALTFIDQNQGNQMCL